MNYMYYAGFKWYAGSEAVENLPIGGHELHIVEEVKRILSKDSGGIFVDVGAHYGLYTIHLARFFNEVWAFEPHPKNIRILEINTRLNNIQNVRLHNTALWDSDGEVYLKIGVGADSRIHSGRWYADSSGEGIKVMARTLDSLKPYRTRYIKIDVEGNGHKVLAGAVKTITRDKPLIQIEYHSQDEIHGCDRLLTGIGYSVLTSFPYPPFHLSIWRFI